MEEDSDDDFDEEQYLLAVQVQKYYYQGFYPIGVFVIWSLLRADCYDLSGCDNESTRDFEQGNPPIIYASKRGSIVLLRLLLKYKADINALSKLRETALIVASRNKRLEVIKFLLKRGASPDLVDRTGYSALRWAVVHEHVPMVNLLLKHASVTKDCYTAGSALDIARKGTSERHALVLKALETKLVAEREALLLQIAEVKNQDTIEEIDQYRQRRQLKRQAKAAEQAKATEASAQAALKLSKKLRKQKIVADAKSRRAIEESVGTRVPTPVERIVGKTLEDIGESTSSSWVKVGAGKWQTRDHLQETSTAAQTAATSTLVESFAADRKAARELLTSDGKWKLFLGRQVHSSVSTAKLQQAQLTIEDIE